MVCQHGLEPPRLVGQGTWRNSGESVGNLVSGNYRVEFLPRNGYRHPDAMIVCNRAGLGASWCEQPSVIFEIVSESTRSIDERPLTRQAFVVSYYHGLPAEEAKQRAKELGKWLTAQGIERARAYLAQAKSGPLWLTVVYFEGAEQRAEVAAKLTELRDVPDANFAWLRKNTKGWPEWMSIQ